MNTIHTPGHCPGNWSVTRKPDNYMTSFEIRSYAAPDSPSGLIDEHIAEVDGQENAALIASAPSLLAEVSALKARCAELEGALRFIVAEASLCQEHIDIARAALAGKRVK